MQGRLAFIFVLSIIPQTKIRDSKKQSFVAPIIKPLGWGNLQRIYIKLSRGSLTTNQWWLKIIKEGSGKSNTIYANNSVCSASLRVSYCFVDQQPESRTERLSWLHNKDRWNSASTAYSAWIIHLEKSVVIPGTKLV